MNRDDGTIRRAAGRGLLGLAAVCAVLAGCGRGGPLLVPVSGRVTFDGRPVESGEILFRAADGAVASHAGPIVAGRYETRVPAGPKRVEIIATRRAAKVAEKPGGGGESPPAEMYVPDRYNAASTLTAEVTADGPNEFDFTLAGDRHAK